MLPVGTLVPDFGLTAALIFEVTPLGRSRWALWIAVGDVVITFVAYVLGFLVRHGGFPERNWNAFLQVAPVILVATVLILALYNEYRDLHRPFLEVAGGCVLSAIAVALVAGLGAYLQIGARPFPRSVWLLGAFFQALFLPTWRIWFVRDAKRLYFQKPAVLITERPGASPGLPSFIRVTDVCNTRIFLSRASTYQDHLIIIDSDVAGSERQRLLEWAAVSSTDVYLFPNLYDVVLSGAQVSKLGDRPVISVQPLVIPEEYKWIKRAFDLLSALVLIILFTPIWVLIPLTIWLESRGPVLYRQERMGERGRIFHLYKFRTMVVDAERDTGPVLAQPDDQRVTRVGRLLRATRFDELPQLFNVLKGEMSMVGPRPERPVFVAEYAATDPNFRLRELAKPGLTGLAQVMGRYATKPEDKLRYDLLYVARYSPWLDLRILLWTVQVMLFPQTFTDHPPGWVQELDWQLGTDVGRRRMPG